MTKDKKIIIRVKRDIGLGIILVIIISFLIYQCSPPQRKSEEERIVINLTTSESDLIPKLHSQGFIRNPLVFNLFLTLRRWHGKIEPGSYLVSKGMSVFKLADVLVNHPYQKWVVIPEGLRKEEVAFIIKNKLNLTDSQEKEFLANSKEGYLFPDTYLLNLDYSGQEIAAKMTNQFDEKVADLFIKAQENNLLNDTLIVLASLVQREAANEEEMPLIAAIIWNRWFKKMPFEIDATVQYALGEPGNWWPLIKPEDYQTDAPYNTYLHQGRPPAPICNPGLAAIEAVIYPKDSDYLYYLHDKEKQIHCALTYEEHLENIDRYLTSGISEEK